MKISETQYKGFRLKLLPGEIEGRFIVQVVGLTPAGGADFELYRTDEWYHPDPAVAQAEHWIDTAITNVKFSLTLTGDK